MLLNETWKKVVAFAVGMVLLIALAFGVGHVLNNALRANNHNPQQYGVFRIRLAGDGWSQTRREEVGETLKELRMLGPEVVLVADTDPPEVTGLPVWIDNERPNVCHAGIYQVFPRDNNSVRVTLFPACIGSSLEFRAAFMHEVGHGMGMRHICRTAGEGDDCSPVGYGISFMNPSLVYDDVSAGSFTFSVPMVRVEGLDVLEYRRGR